ncbi:hypothetical protein ACFQES_46030 [Nonomuraea salmonea]|uniref:hypothetical protein n=1 Tax=Nonomuraea salmonea TaxID=46181 RepID=UPI00360B336E
MTASSAGHRRTAIPSAAAGSAWRPVCRAAARSVVAPDTTAYAATTTTATPAIQPGCHGPGSSASTSSPLTTATDPTMGRAASPANHASGANTTRPGTASRPTSTPAAREPGHNTPPRRNRATSRTLSTPRLSQPEPPVSVNSPQ